MVGSKQCSRQEHTAKRWMPNNKHLGKFGKMENILLKKLFSEGDTARSLYSPAAT